MVLLAVGGEVSGAEYRVTLVTGDKCRLTTPILTYGVVGHLQREKERGEKR